MRPVENEVSRETGKCLPTRSRAAKPRPKPYKIADASRLFLLVAPSGGKLWRWNYDFDGRSKTMALGAWPLVTLADARAKRDEAYTILCDGHDPAVEKKLKKEAAIEASRQTFERVAREWHANATPQWARVHAGDVLRSLERDVFPSIGDLPITRLALRFLALTAVRPNELRGARWDEFEDRNGTEPLWRIPASRMKGDQDRKEEIGGDHLVPLTRQAISVLKALWPFTGEVELLFTNARHVHRPMSENAIGYLLHRAGYHGHHVPHGFRAAFSTIMNEWVERHGKEHDRKVIDLMLAHVPNARPCADGEDRDGL